MKIFSDATNYSTCSLFMTRLIFFLGILFSLPGFADPIDNLQQSTSAAYEKMMQARRTADIAAKDAVLAEKKLDVAKQKLAAAEKEAEISRKKSDQARTALEEATNQWEQLSDSLSREWGKTDNR